MHYTEDSVSEATFTIRTECLSAGLSILLYLNANNSFYYSDVKHEYT